METSNSPPTSSDSQTRRRKGRNSDIRKEQNRIASRAYREKRRQKLALLDEILKGDTHTDSMSSVSDESTTPAPEFRAMESTGKSRHSSNSPVPYYMSAIPALPSVPAGIHLPSNGPNRDTEAYVGYGYSVKNYDSQETERLAPQHTSYADSPNMSTAGMSSGYVSPLPSSITPILPTPMFPFDEEFVGDSFSAYSQLETSVPSFSAASGYDSNMINALQSLSRLNDTQQQQIVAYLQKKRGMQPAATDNPFHIGYGSYQVPVPRSSPISGHLQHSQDIIQPNKEYSERYASKSHR